MKRRNRNFSTAILWTLFISWNAGQCDAAQIEVDRTTKKPLVLVSGTLNPEDGQIFADKVSGLAEGIVVLGSPGGSLMAGLRIGTLIQLKNFATVVPDEAACASACAFAWLGGTVRYMGQRALVGFHAAYRIENGRAMETGAGNALVGAYLNRLGLSDAAIVYITSAPPSDITWLSIGDARKLGINVTILPSNRAARNSGPPVTAPDSPTLPSAPKSPPESGPRTTQTIKLDEVAKTFANTYFAHWSESNADALQYFSGVYAEQINFYDRPIQRRALLDEKRKYAARWPERVYTAHPDSIKTSCDLNSSACTITGQVEWDCRDPKRGLRSVGMANFTLQITVSQLGAVRVEGEWSSVVSRRE